MTQRENGTDFANNITEKLRNDVKCAIMELTDKQAEYVLWRLQCLTKENKF